MIKTNGFGIAPELQGGIAPGAEHGNGAGMLFAILVIAKS
jgi:hypothetical protein